MRDGGLNNSSRILSLLLLFGIDTQSLAPQIVKSEFQGHVEYLQNRSHTRQAMFYMLIDEPEHLIFMDDT